MGCSSDIPGTGSGLFIKFFQTYFFDFLVDQYPTFIKASIKIGSVTGELVAQVAVINHCLLSLKKFDYRGCILEIGVTPLGYLQQLRVETAKRLLEEGSQTFNEITYLVGYEDISFFRKVFVRLTGLRPKEYQQRFTGYSAKPVLQ